MNICFLSSMHPARDKRVFDKEAISLVSAGYSVVHLCPGDKHETGVHSGVRIVTYPKPAGILARFGQLFRLYQLAKKQGSDVYHCNEVDSWFVGVLLRFFCGKKCVFDVHEHYPSTFAESRFPKLLQPTIASIIRLAFRVLTPFTDRFVLAKKTVSSDFHCPESKKVLVRNFTPLSGVKFAGDRSANFKDEVITIIHLGLFGKIRGWPQVLDALKIMQNANVKLEVIGEFNDGTRDEFDAVVKQYCLQDRVTVYDWMPFEEAFKYLTNAHIGLVAFQPNRLNHVYAMPHKMFDYMAAGMAVICPDFAVEVAPVVQETECGFLVDPSNFVDIANKLDELVSDPNLIFEMGKKGQQAVYELYNWESEAEHLVAMYRGLELLQ